MSTEEKRIKEFIPPPLSLFRICDPKKMGQGELEAYVAQLEKDLNIARSELASRRINKADAEMRKQ